MQTLLEVVGKIVCHKNRVDHLRCSTNVRTVNARRTPCGENTRFQHPFTGCDQGRALQKCLERTCETSCFGRCQRDVLRFLPFNDPGEDRNHRRRDTNIFLFQASKVSYVLVQLFAFVSCTRFDASNRQCEGFGRINSGQLRNALIYFCNIDRIQAENSVSYLFTKHGVVLELFDFAHGGVSGNPSESGNVRSEICLDTKLSSDKNRLEAYINDFRKCLRFTKQSHRDIWVGGPFDNDFVHNFVQTLLHAVELHVLLNFALFGAAIFVAHI
mmetsp:Transcript_58043/g.102032  ORF Transcript_58043/g.102032 Transcript_58043/m.102032 type:complete len:271 (+) Transcript_58043:654-1466(+)